MKTFVFKDNFDFGQALYHLYFDGLTHEINVRYTALTINISNDVDAESFTELLTKHNIPYV